MTALEPAQRDKLAKMLALLGSAHAGERDAAALAADRMVRGAGVTWRDVLAGQNVTDHIGDLTTCSLRPDLLTQWEKAFLSGLAGRRSVSSRQREILAGVAARVRAAGPRAG